MKEKEFSKIYLELLNMYSMKNLRMYDKYNEFDAEEYFSALKSMSEFTKELSEYVDENDNIKINYKDFDELMFRHFDKARESNRKDALHLLFDLWEDCRFSFNFAKKNLVLNCYSSFVRSPNMFERELADKFKDKVNYKNLTILTYRDIDALIDDYGDAHLYKDGEEVAVFTLQWDWWYPIDMYLAGM